MGHEPETSKAARWPPLIFFSASLTLYAKALFGSEVFFYRDVLHYYWPTRAAVAEAFSRFELPQWDPHHHGGLPLLADIHAGVLYPPNLIFQVASFFTAYAWLLVLHQTLAGWGAYFLARRLRLGVLPAVATGLAYMLAGPVAGLCNAGALMAGAAGLPWALGVLLSPRPVLQRIVLLGLLGSALALCGDPQSVLYVGLLGAVLVAWQEQRREGALTLGFGLLLAGVIAACQLFPGWMLLENSTRADGGSPTALEWAVHPLRLFELAAPLPFGGYLEAPQFWAWFSVKGPGSVPFSLSIYLGASTLVLALLGLSRQRRVGLGCSFLGLGLVLALAPHLGLGPLLASAPPFRFFRYPEKYVLLSALGLAILAGLGLERISRAQVSRRRLLVLTAGWVAALGGWAVLRWVPTIGARLFVWVLAMTGTQGTPQGPLESACSALLWFAGFGLLALATVWAASSARGGRWGSVPMMVVLALDLVLVGRRVVWTAPRESFAHTPALAAQLLASSQGATRFFRDDEAFKSRSPASRDPRGLLELRRWQWDTLKSNLGALYGLDEASGYGPAQLQGWKAVYEVFKLRPERFGAVWGACLLARPDASPILGPAAHLEMNPECVPRLHLVEEVLGAPSMVEGAQLLGRPAADLRRTAVVIGTQERKFEPGLIEGIQIDARGAKATVTVPQGGGFIVLANSYYPGWSVQIDGAPADLELVNLATQGTQLPAGRHRVEFHFEDPSLATGFSFSAIGLLAAAVLWLRGSKGSRANPGQGVV